MAIDLLAHFSEARGAGADGAYTDQVVVMVPDDTAPVVMRIAHDLGRIPDWVRVKQLSLEPSLPPVSYLVAIVKPAVSALTGRFQWEDTVLLEVFDPAEELLFTVACAAGAPSPVDAYYMIEFGITHSVPK